jgi:rRNA-processing protein FCF1
MVLEGAAKAAATRVDTATSGQVEIVQARGSGDDAIVDLVRELPGRRAVVTADRELQNRCAAAGATILRPGWLLSQLREEAT